MNTKILLTLFLSLFCIDGLARVAVKPKPRTTPGAVKNGSSAFKTEIPLNPTRNCSGSCVQAAQETLSPKGVRILNETPSAERGDFMNLLPPIYGELIALHKSTNPSEATSIQKVASQHAIAREQAQSSMTAIASAKKKSVSNSWPQPAKDNLTKFIHGLADGINSEEAKKLKLVEENCT